MLLLSAYDAASHRDWHQGLRQALPEIDWTVLSLPPRHFSWRIRGNALTWSGLEYGRLNERYDRLLATSMVDLATLRGLVPALAHLPTVLYFHENQFAYPTSTRQHTSVEPQMVSLYASLCADRLVFNSAYNRSTFLAGVDALLRKLPDGVPPGIVEQLRGKSSIVPVPLRMQAPPAARDTLQSLTLVWNHRWEYDKGPDLLLAALESLDADLPLRVHVIGQQFRRVPEAFARIRELLEGRNWLGHWGYVEAKGEYQMLLARSHLVLSTANHDFQGLAVLEAVQAGCIPLVPADLAYPEFLPGQFCYARGNNKAASNIGRAITRYCELWRGGSLPAAPDLSWLTWESLALTYRNLLTPRLRT